MEPFHMLFSMWKFSDLWCEGCEGCVRDVMCEGYDVWGMWCVRDMMCEGCDVWGMWCVRDVRCEGCDVWRMWWWGMWCVRDVMCEGCNVCTRWTTPQSHGWTKKRKYTFQTSLRMARWQLTSALLPTENNFSRWQIDNQLNTCPLPVNILHGNAGIAPFPMPLGTVALPWIPADKQVQLLSNTAEAMYMQE